MTTFTLSDLAPTRSDIEKYMPEYNMKSYINPVVVKGPELPRRFSASNGFVGALVQAYSYHLPVEFSPDDVWFAIMLQFNYYVNGRAEALRDKFVAHEGKKQLTISAATDLQNIFSLCERMTELMSENMKDKTVVDWMMPKFSTTDESAKIAYAVASMATFQKYFEFKFELCCGLTQVTILGNCEDWVNLRERLDRLKEFCIDGLLTEFHGKMVKIVDQFINRFKNETLDDETRNWWQSICTFIPHGSGGQQYLDGWIADFLMFDENGKRAEGIEARDIPTGVVKVPVVVDDNGDEFTGEMFAGHTGFVYDGVFRPRFDYVLTRGVDRRREEASAETKAMLDSMRSGRGF